MGQVITIMSDSGQLVDLQVDRLHLVGPTFGAWIIDSNSVYLGSERYEEWESISGNVMKQREFLTKVEKLKYSDLFRATAELGSPDKLLRT